MKRGKKTEMERKSMKRKQRERGEHKDEGRGGTVKMSKKYEYVRWKEEEESGRSEGCLGEEGIMSRRERRKKSVVCFRRKSWQVRGHGPADPARR